MEIHHDDQGKTLANMSGIIQPLTTSSPITSNNDVWAIDTGATDHMVNNNALFSRITSTKSSYVRLPNGEAIPVTHKRDVHISVSIILLDTLCVPSLCSQSSQSI